tara:strand:+ start:726 stop:1259 length:534 start_codon:yes stop_codon:yes gene_type:complete
MLIYLGYFAVVVISLHFVLSVLKIQSDYIYNTSIGFPNDKLKGSVIEGFKEGFSQEYNEKDVAKIEKAGDEIDVLLEKLKTDMTEPMKKTIKSAPQDTKDAIVDLMDFITEVEELQFVHGVLNYAKGNPKGFVQWINSNKKFKEMVKDPERAKTFRNILKGKVGVSAPAAAASSGWA